jgi:hypothetical protein
MFDPKTYSFDVEKMTEFFKQNDFTKHLAKMNMPGMDAQALMAAQQKNMDALVEANKAAAAGWLCSPAPRSKYRTQSRPAWPLKDGVVPVAHADRESPPARPADSPQRGNSPLHTSLQKRTEATPFNFLRRTPVNSST